MAQKRRGLDVLYCAYCGFGKSINWWFELEMYQAGMIETRPAL